MFFVFLAHIVPYAVTISTVHYPFLAKHLTT